MHKTKKQGITADHDNYCKVVRRVNLTAKTAGLLALNLH